MKRMLVFCLLCFAFSNIKAQYYDDYSYVDAKVLSIPDSVTFTTADIASYIQTNFKTDGERYRAAYTWITNNIQYNKDSMYYRFWGEDPERKLSSILKSRKGVCENFASLLTRIANRCGITCYMVNGYTKPNGIIDYTGHSWCAVYLDKKWYLSDPTWDAGNRNVYRYFLSEPNDFLTTHMPFDYLWQLNVRPVSNKEFKQGFNSGKQIGFFNYSDSAFAFLQSDTLRQMEDISRRMKKAGLEADDLRTWYAYNEMKIFIVYQEKDMNTFNAAVADLNKAKKQFNEFVQYRNNHFQPAKSDAAINAIFISIDSLLKSVAIKLTEIGTRIENYQYDTDGLSLNLGRLQARVKEQKIFLKKYFATNVNERSSLLH